MSSSATKKKRMRWVILLVALGACGGTAAESERTKEPAAASTVDVSPAKPEPWPSPEVYAQRVSNVHCGDFLRAHGIVVPDLEFVGCESSNLSQLSTWRARYRVAGAKAEAARAALQARIGVPKELRFECCGHTTGALGQWIDEAGVHYDVSMTSEETTERDVSKVREVVLTVHLLRELP